jgi:hypothetical protein
LFHDRLKHNEIKYHFIRDKEQKGAVKLQYISANEQIADILTKTLVKGKFVYFRDKLGVVENTSLAKRECRCFCSFERYSHKWPWCRACGNIRWHLIALSFG